MFIANLTTNVTEIIDNIDIQRFISLVQLLVKPPPTSRNETVSNIKILTCEFFNANRRHCDLK